MGNKIKEVQRSKGNYRNGVEEVLFNLYKIKNIHQKKKQKMWKKQRQSQN